MKRLVCAKIMDPIRSWACIAALAAFTGVSFVVVGSMVFFVGTKKCYTMGWRFVSTGYKLIMQYIGGLDYVVLGERPDKNRSVMYAIRHESAWETLVFPYEFVYPLVFLKKELARIPIFNMFMYASLCVFVDRSKGVEGIRNGIKRVKCALELDTRHVIIFPEGRRMESGVYRGIQRGIVQFYHAANVPVVPVVLDSGKYWPCKQLKITPGVIKVKFMPEIPAGLSKHEILSRLEESFVTGLKEIGNYKEAGHQTESAGNEQGEDHVDVNAGVEHHENPEHTSKHKKAPKKHAKKPVKHAESEASHEPDNA